MSVVWQIPYEKLKEFSYVFKQLSKYLTDYTSSSSIVFKYFKWYYEIQNEFEENLCFTENEYRNIMKWLSYITNKKSIILELDVFSCIHSEYLTSLHKYITKRSFHMGNYDLINRFLKENICTS